MKKKLYCILLSLAIAVTMMPLATMTAFGGEITTVGEVLATNSDFPTSEDDGWENEKGTKAYLSSDDKLYFGTAFAGTYMNVNDNGNGIYVYSEYGGNKVTFTIEGEALVSIKCENYDEDINGTYTAPKKDDKCITYKAVKNIAGTHTLKLNKKDVGEYKFIPSFGGYKIQDYQTNEFLGIDNNGKLTREAFTNTVWTYKNNSFSAKYTKKAAWFMPPVTKVAYLACDKEKNLRTTSIFTFAQVCKKVERNHHLNTLFLNKKDGTHVAICALCGAKTVQEHCFGKLTKRCICGAKNTTYKITLKSEYGEFFDCGTYERITSINVAPGSSYAIIYSTAALVVIKDKDGTETPVAYFMPDDRDYEDIILTPGTEGEYAPITRNFTITAIGTLMDNN